MRVRCLLCGGWSWYDGGLYDKSTEHEPDCGERRRRVRERVLAETNGRTDIFSTSTSLFTDWQTSHTERG